MNQNVQASRLWCLTGESAKWPGKRLIMQQLVSWGSPRTSPLQAHPQPWQMRAGPGRPPGVPAGALPSLIPFCSETQ